MRRILLLFAFFAAVSTENDNQLTKCIQMMNPATLSCCLSGNHRSEELHADNIKECFKIPQSLNSCDRAICIANKLGFASSDGIIDKNKVRSHIEDNFKDDTDLKNAIIDKCVEGDLDKFGTEDICDLKKMKLCWGLQFSSVCSNWDIKGLCAGVQEILHECVEHFS